ncbi:MAG: hypothetical protein ABSH08_14000, partial [Tepidisphaeraceae bacterium]
QNLLGARMGLSTSNSVDFASSLYPPTVTSGGAIQLPLMSSVGLVVYDHDAYVSQHARAPAMDNSSSPPTQVTIGNNPPDQFTDVDMNSAIFSPPSSSDLTTASTFAQDKYLEELWIDQNGTAMLVSPNSGSLLKAK